MSVDDHEQIGADLLDVFVGQPLDGGRIAGVDPRFQVGEFRDEPRLGRELAGQEGSMRMTGIE